MSGLDPGVSGQGLDIGFLCHGWPPDAGGVESHTQDLARALALRGHRVHVLCLDYGEGLEPYSTHTSMQAGVELRRMAYRYHDHAALADLVRNARAEDVVAAWMAETPCDLIHVHHLTGFGSGALRLIHELGQPAVITLHDYWSLCPRGQMLRPDGGLCAEPEASTCGECLANTWPHLMPSKQGKRRGPHGELVANDAQAALMRSQYALSCLRLPQRRFAPSEAARAVYARAGLPAQSVVVLPNGIELEQLAEQVRGLRAHPRPPATGLRLGVLGSVLPSKGVLELAQAFVEADIAGLSLEVHGPLPAYHGDSRYVDALRALAAGEPRIRLHGGYTREALPAILAGLDGVAAPARWVEVFGLTLREARAAGLPVLVSDAGDLAAAAEGGRAGIVVPAQDRAAWVAALRRFAGDAAARAAWSTAAPAAVPRTRDMLLVLEAHYVAAIRELTGKSPRLVHPLAEPAPEPGTAPAAAAPQPQKPGFFKRLFGA